ncbi:MAG: methyltransferase domain-containing protein [Aliiglaciecola sp.]|uniref:class I SAM-dependent methyltransferase n=1 Tax=Aliiglaciecola sp. TaxID=1872441 RepID=UPI003298B1EA
MTDNNIEFYNRNAVDIFEQYQSVSFQSIHQNWLSLVSLLPGSRALDVGAGSGRDAKALSELGFIVTAVEPAKLLYKMGCSYCEDKVEWIDDSLPSLSQLNVRTFDLILISAVWMHLTNNQQLASLTRIFGLLNENGLVVITLRHGTFQDSRTSSNLNADITIKQAESLGLTCVFNQEDVDKLDRSSVNWQTLVFAKQGVTQ